MMHTEPHILAGKVATLATKGPWGEAGAVYRVEDWWDRINGKSLQDSPGNPAVLTYMARTTKPLNDDDVVYGKVGPYGHIVHVSELTSN